MSNAYATLTRPTGKKQNPSRLVRTGIMFALYAQGAAWIPAQAFEPEDLELVDERPPEVSIATGSSMLLRRAPAVTTVITAQDITAIGATDLESVLETVPGLHVSRSPLVSTPLYVIRGINLGYNPQVLMLINGIPQTIAYTGNRGDASGEMPLENIARIEVIRGPGSALYGAEAFAGVINIITRRGEELGGTQVGLRTGTYQSHDAWLTHGSTWGPVSVAAFLRRGRTDGANRTVSADAQTGWDQVLGGQASHAPGPTNNQREFTDGSLDLGMGHWRMRLGYRDRAKVGSGTGVASALDPTGQSRAETITADLGYEQPQITPDLGLSIQTSWMHFTEQSDLTLFPPGFRGFYNDPFQDGLIGNPYKWERHARASMAATYTGWSAHRVLLGIGIHHESLYKIRETKNFRPDFSRINQGAASDVIDVTDTIPFIQPHDRTKRHLVVQDEWGLAKDWTLTAGWRHDHFSDFGHTSNPRLALVWDAAYDLTAKLLYGTAFRAPSFAELYAINNPVVTGNATLKPERIKTLEAALSWQAAPPLQLGLNVFHYEMRDIIRLLNFRYENTGQQTGAGLELEARWDISPTMKLSGNYSYQHATDQTTGQDAGNAPNHHLYTRFDWRFAAGWAVHAQLNQIGERPRVDSDTRPSLAGYGTVDLSLHMNPKASSWGLSASVRNLLNADVREPSPFDRSALQPFISIPNDYPQAGRTFYVQATYKF